MAHLTHVVPGEKFQPAAADWNSFVDATRVVQSQRVIFASDSVPANDQPILMRALENFSSISGGTDYCVGSADALVGKCVELLHDPNLVQNYYVNQLAYQRFEGAAVCVWSPAESRCDSTVKIQCGQIIWVMWNQQAGRYEAISAGLPTDTLADCACVKFGYSLWKIGYNESDEPIWELDQNHCSGCYPSTERTPTIPPDFRFLETTLNDDWLTEPSADPAIFDPLTTSYDENFRMVVCCGVPDEPPPPPCDLECCYSVSGIPNVVCDGESPGTHSRHLGHTAPCAWASDDPGSQIDLDVTNDEGTCENTWTFQAGEGVTMSTSTLVVKWVATWRTQFGGPLGDTVETYGRIITAAYSLSAPPDCVSTLTANLTNTWATGDSLPGDCKTCGLTDAYFAGLVPSSLTVSPTSCTTTTTTTTSTTTPSTTSTTSSTTTPSTTSTTSTTTSTSTSTSTTSTTTETSTTTGTSSTTTVSSTTTGTTGSTTTASTTAGPCTGFVTWKWLTDAIPVHWGVHGGGCAPPCEAPYPSFDGTYPGQETDTFCA